MAEASILSTKPKRKDINKFSELDEKWYLLGTELEIDDEELDKLEEKYTKDLHKRLIKMFGMWLEKGENPTYRKLLKALVSIGKREVAESICIKLGLTSSLDNLLSATCQVPLSQCIPAQLISQTQQTDVAESVMYQRTIYSDSTASDSTCAPGQLSKSDSIHTSVSTQHSMTIDKPTPAAPYDSVTSFSSGASSRVLIQHKGNGHSYDTSTVGSSEPVHNTLIRFHDKLVTAFSTDIVNISEVLVAKEFVPAELSEKMINPFLIPKEKAIALVNAVIDKIKIAPKRFQELMKMFSEHTCTKEIVEQMSSHASQDSIYTQNKAGVIFGSKQYAICEDHVYSTLVHFNPGPADNTDQNMIDTERRRKASSSGDSPSSEEYTFPTLSSDDEAELEAQLITSAENMTKKFAALLWNTVESFKYQEISPRSLVTGVLAITEYENPSVGKPLLEREKEALAKAQSIDAIFDILRPHMTFFNYEILEFLIERVGSKEDKRTLKVYLRDFRYFCRRSVFEVPKSVLGHNSDKAVGQQYFHVKVTETFKSAFLSECTKDSESSSVKICAPELGISLENAKRIQRKIAMLLKLKVSSLYLDSISAGSTILTFLIPACISLAGLDSDPDIIALSTNGIHILCGPSGKPESKELTSNGLVVQWSQPEYGHPTLAKYVLHYQKKCSETKPLNEWQKLELNSLETHTCVPGLSSGDTYIFKICTVSDVGSLQYSNKSDPIVISADGILTNNIHKVIVANKDTLTLAFSSADPNTIAVMLSIKGVISKEDEAQISLTSTPRENAILLITAIEHQVKSTPEKFKDFLNALSEAKLSLAGDVVKTLWSDYYDSVYKQYLDYLKFLYASLDKKQTSSDQWPPSATKKFFRLTMIKTAEVQRGKIDDKFVRMTITGKVDDILQEKYPIQLEDIFKETEHQRQVSKENEDQKKVILLEGAPGCGKSTLSVYICQQWEKGQLFNQFKLVILIRLRDPAVKSAEGLADLLPCPDTTTAQQIAAKMLANKCQDVLFILDGWDELPPNLRENSIFHQLVQPKLPQSNLLCGSTVIVTSRPIASGDLYRVVSSRVEILGFTAEELHQFFTECLKGDTEAVKMLLEKIEENPEVAGSCYLPLNATILVHLFRSDRNTLPTTLYGIFSSLVLNCIKRHLKLRTQYKDVSIESLDQLPELQRSHFWFFVDLLTMV